MLPNPLERWGVKFAATYIGEALGNPSGGLKQGDLYEGRLNLAVDVDLEKLAGMRQLAFHANLFQIHGGGLSRGALLNFMDVSGIEALPSTRLYEMWFEQKWGTKLALRAGQLAADTEFMTAKYTDVFTNASLGWPAGLSLNMPSGGPSPPLAAVGARLRADVTDNLSLLGAVFDGDAAGPGPQDPQLRNRYGVNFRVNDPPLLLGEMQLLWNAKKGDPGLDGKFKFGAWRHFGDFSDQRLSASGVTLADPASGGTPAMLRGDFGVYSVFEQKLYRVRTTTTAGSVFLHGRPTARRTAISSTITPTAGLNSSGSAISGQRTSSGLPRLTRMCRRGPARSMPTFETCPGRAGRSGSFEGLFTAVYQYEIRAGWTLQPNFQYIVHPGGGATNPLGNNPGKVLKNADVFGLRTVVKF